MAPRFSFHPEQKARDWFPFRPNRSSTDTSRTSCRVSGWTTESTTGSTTSRRLRMKGPFTSMESTVARPFRIPTLYSKSSGLTSGRFMEPLRTALRAGARRSKAILPSWATRAPLLITRSTLKLAGSSMMRMSASLPGAMEPTRWSIR